MFDCPRSARAVIGLWPDAFPYLRCSVARWRSLPALLVRGRHRRPITVRPVAAGLTAVLIAVLGTGVASAAGPLQSCSARVVDQPGAQILMSPAAVEAPIVNALVPLDPLGILRPLFQQAWAVVPPIPLGTIPATGTLTVTGDAVANAVSAQLLTIPVLAPVLNLLLDSVWTTITQACSVVGEAVGGTQPAPSPPAPSQPGARQPAPVPAPGTTPRPAAPAPGGGGVAPEPAPAAPPPVSPTQSNVALEYPVEWKNAAPGAGIPPEGIAVKLGTPTQPNGYAGAPQFGILGRTGTTTPNSQTAGTAEALSGDAAQSPIGPILLAALMAMLVAAQWGRTWLLRRTEPATPRPTRLGLRWRKVKVPLPVLARRDRT